MTDPSALLDAYARRKEISNCGCSMTALGDAAPRAFAALRAVLELKPPELDEDEDPQEHALLEDGWRTCHTAVIRAITKALEGNE